ncbi:WecB/TagA/CpsF family glycosyltransferase [Parabacteroides sp. Marseille-P3160]|uniref:WecB/TagA/CpsF family glycosyltransferase n=1 Tax=Parabacteroides sp. Marseille-P3160 TaxID=1917887 RepID=UPI0009B9D62B|nr:WecB/TagA/CpsF family glycosyltransferase [Parabacteroides sp. Marseille-P3160]
MSIKSILKKAELTELDYVNIFEKKGKIYSFLNPYGYHLMRKNQTVFNNLDGLFFDGILLCLLYRIFYGKKITRRSFDMTTVAQDLFDRINDTGESIYFIGAKQEEIDRSVKQYKMNYSNLNIIGYRNGYFKDLDEMDQSIKQIIDFLPDFVVVGMGAIKQEDFINRLKVNGFKGIAFTCGGYIRQSSRGIFYFPFWTNKFHLRAFYRLYKEKETWKRLYNVLIQFPYLFIIDFLSSHKMKNETKLRK